MSSAVVLVAFGLLTVVSDKLFGLNDASTSMVLKLLAASVDAIAGIVGMAIYARLTAAVLTRKLPGFPRRGWTALHVTIGAVFGLGNGALALFGDAQTTGEEFSKPVETALLLGATAAAGILGALVGLVWGGLQALIIRTAARHVGAWVGWSAVAGAFIVSSLPVAFFKGPSFSDIANSLAIEAFAFVATIIGAIIMVPAVNRLVPRT